MNQSALAKINLFLRVGPVAASGFHPVQTWMCTVGFGDLLAIEPSDQLSLACNDPNLPTDERNLVLQAARLLQRESAGDRGASIRLHKLVPIGSGLGGGSSDAANTLQMLNGLWQLNLSGDTLHRLAAELGSDVPFFLAGQSASAICTGRGEITTPTPRPKPKTALLLLPKIAMPTAGVYRRFDELGLGTDLAKLTTENYASWSALSADALLPRLVNDLEAPAFSINPDLGRLRAGLEQQIGRLVRMSGSGSTLFTLFNHEADAWKSADALRDQVEPRVVDLCPDGTRPTVRTRPLE